jgi:hypothetical protein
MWSPDNLISHILYIRYNPSCEYDHDVVKLVVLRRLLYWTQVYNVFDDRRVSWGAVEH